jgi:hypothetical protein
LKTTNGVIQGRRSVGVTVFYLTDRPGQARWLPPDERDWLVSKLQAELDAKKTVGELLDAASVLRPANSEIDRSSLSPRTLTLVQSMRIILILARHDIPLAILFLLLGSGFLVCLLPTPSITLAPGASVFGIYCPLQQNVSPASGAPARYR